MKALLGDGRVIELGHRFIRIEGETGDDKTTVLFKHVAGEAIDCEFACTHTIIEDRKENLIQKTSE